MVTVLKKQPTGIRRGVIVATVAVLALLISTAKAFAQEEGEAEGGEDCAWYEVTCNAGEAVKAEVSGTLGKIIDLILTLASQLFSYLMDFFRRDPVTNPDAIQESIAWATDTTEELVIYAVAFSIIIGAGRIAVARADQQMQQGTETGKASIKAALAATVSAPILMVLISTTDALSEYFFSQAGDIDAAKSRIQDMLVTETSELTTERLLLLIVAIMAIFAFLDLLVQLFLRQFLFIAATVFLPIAGAATTGEQGKGVWDAILRLLTGLLLFKPICALVFSIGIRYANDQPEDTGNDFVTVLLFIAPVLAMPILLQLVGGAGGSTGGGMMAAGGAAGMLKATGGIGRKASAAGRAAKGAMSGGGKAAAGAAGSAAGGAMGGARSGMGGTGAGGGGGRGFGGGGTGGGGTGGGGGASAPKPTPTPPPAMQNRSPSSQPRTTPSSQRSSPSGSNKPAGGAKTPKAQGAHSPQGGGRGQKDATQGAKTGQGGQMQQGDKSRAASVDTPAHNSPAQSQQGAHQSEAAQSTQPSTREHRQRLSQAWPMYDQQPVMPTNKGGRR